MPLRTDSEVSVVTALALVVLAKLFALKAPPMPRGVLMDLYLDARFGISGVLVLFVIARP